MNLYKLNFHFLNSIPIKIFLAFICTTIVNEAFAQTPCIQKKPTNPYYLGSDILCIGTKNPDLSLDILPDSSTFGLEWTTDTLSSPTSTPPTISTATANSKVVYVRQFKTATPSCHSYYQKLEYSVLPIPGKPSLKPLLSGPFPYRKINICEGYSVNLSDSLTAVAGLTARWYSQDAVGNKTYFDGLLTKANYTAGTVTYYAQLGGGGYCYGDTLQVKVNVTPLPQNLQAVSPGTICDSTNIRFGSNNALVGVNPTYDWYVNNVKVTNKSGDSYTIPKNTFHAGDPVKVFYIIHIDKFAPYYHCDSVGPPFSSDTVSVKILPYPKLPGAIIGANIVYEGQKNVYYKVRLDTTLVYKWRFSNPKHGTLKFANNTATISYSDSLDFSFNKPYLDTITLLVKNGCDSTKEYLYVSIWPYLRPINILTPNGDNINDTWIIKNIDNEVYRNNQVMIYDRFGVLVYKQQNYSNAGAWDGKFKGQPLSEGTYYYLIFYFENGYKKVVKGALTILRGR